MSVYDLSDGVQDWRKVNEWLALGRGCVVDSQGIDWWDLNSPLVRRNLLEMLLAMRLAARLKKADEITASRPCSWAGMISAILGVDVGSCRAARGLTHWRGLRRYLDIASDLTMPQLCEIALDKWDPVYRLRRHLRRTPSRTQGVPVVLLPSAYINVSRSAISYARMLPQKTFMLVTTRRSGRLATCPPNVVSAPLSDYAGSSTPDCVELRALTLAWNDTEENIFGRSKEMALGARLGFFKGFPAAIARGLAIRNAWQEVFERESISAVLCGDDNNPYLRMPVLIGQRRGVPTVVCHHGAFDYGLITRTFTADIYLAKGEIERDYLSRICGLPQARIHVGAAVAEAKDASVSPDNGRHEKPWILYFSEPYETICGGRSDEIFRESLPHLCSVARKFGKTIVIKLHPFENLRSRERLIRKILRPEDRAMIRIRDAPLTLKMVRGTWFSLIVESSVVVEQTLQGIPCYICGWLDTRLNAYTSQYVRFGAGTMLDRPESILKIPKYMQKSVVSRDILHGLYRPIEPAELDRLLTSER